MHFGQLCRRGAFVSCRIGFQATFCLPKWPSGRRELAQPLGQLDGAPFSLFAPCPGPSLAAAAAHEGATGRPVGHSRQCSVGTISEIMENFSQTHDRFLMITFYFFPSSLEHFSAPGQVAALHWLGALLCSLSQHAGDP